MAPDINSLPNQITDGYRPNTEDSHYVIPDIVLGSPHTRRVKVLTIGAGVSGIMMAYQIMKQCENVEHVIYEKNSDIGGTWLENRYPGCACDIPSHAYTYKFALNPDWPRFFSYSPDIWKYLDKVCEVWNLRRFMTFNTEVIGCYWKEEKGEWLVKLRETKPDGSTREFENTCNVLLHGTGVLNNFKWPDIPGIEKFKGKIMHTARWPKDYQAEQWKEDRVAVIGSGASSIQTVPMMQPHVKQMDVFVRTGVWFVQIANNFGQNKEYDEDERDVFRHDKVELVKHAKSIEDQVNGIWGMFFKDSKLQEEGQNMFRARMAEFIKDERLLQGFTPKFGVGCRRVTPGDPYIQAIQKDNVDVHFTEVTKIDETGVIGADGKHREVDTIVCATGFDVSYRPRFPIVGLNDVDLADKWKVCPEGYLGITIPGYPNLVAFIGPTWPVLNGSAMGPLGQVGSYAIQMIEKIQTEQIRGLAPKQTVTDAFNAHAQEWVKHTVWIDSCRSWYKNNETGRVNAVWPGSSLHYINAIKTPRYEDYDITYLNKHNMWAFLGMGTTPELQTHGADVSPYLSVDNIDPDWLRAVGHYGDERDHKVSQEVKKRLAEKEGPRAGTVGAARADERKDAEKAKTEEAVGGT